MNNLSEFPIYSDGHNGRSEHGLRVSHIYFTKGRLKVMTNRLKIVHCSAN